MLVLLASWSRHMSAAGLFRVMLRAWGGVVTLQGPQRVSPSSQRSTLEV